VSRRRAGSLRLGNGGAQQGSDTRSSGAVLPDSKDKSVAVLISSPSPMGFLVFRPFRILGSGLSVSSFELR